MGYSYYRTTFKITWEDESVETVTTESSSEPESLPKYRDTVRIKRFSHTYTRRGFLLKWRTRTRGSFEKVRELNFRHIKSIDKQVSKEIEVEE